MNNLRYKFRDVDEFTYSNACTSHLTTMARMINSFVHPGQMVGMKSEERKQKLTTATFISCEYHTKDIPHLKDIKYRRRFNRWLMNSAFAPYLQKKGDDVWATWDFNYMPRSTIIFTVMRYAEEYWAITKMQLALAKGSRYNTTAILLSIPYLSPSRGISSHQVLRPSHHFKGGFDEGEAGLALLNKILENKTPNRRPQGVLSGLVGNLGTIEEEFEGIDKGKLVKAPWKYFGGEL